eukprot:NODE_169_length_14535_cov_0.769881.p3 type:complete len:755 gc:universal NODE_169_length_14535_cov_0.769881:8799-11063(+)
MTSQVVHGVRCNDLLCILKTSPVKLSVEVSLLTDSMLSSHFTNLSMIPVIINPATLLELELSGQDLKQLLPDNTTVSQHPTHGAQIYFRDRKDKVVFLTNLDQALGGAKLEINGIEDFIRVFCVGGRKRETLHSIMRTTDTSIYIPSPFHQHPVYITGKEVDQAKEIFLQAMKDLKVQSQVVKCQPYHLNWLKKRTMQLIEIMMENGTCIDVGLKNQIAGNLTIYGEHSRYINRTIRLLGILMAQYVRVKILLISIPNVDAVKEVLAKYSDPLVDSYCTPNSIDVGGPASSVVGVLSHLNQIDTLRTLHKETTGYIELSHEHRDFILGKKNGKVNKIVRSANCKVNFGQGNELNMVIELAGHLSQVKEGLELIMDELPAELSFYVPESYHKRIIGVGGKNIQRIMRKYGVFVKFSNSDEHNVLGGYFALEDNVIARTPMKNKENLPKFRESVLELVAQQDKVAPTTTIKLPFRFHRRLEYLSSKLEEDHQVKIEYPPREFALDIVKVKGYHPGVGEVTKELLTRAIDVLEYHVTSNIKTLAASPDFVKLSKQIQNMDVSIEKKEDESQTTFILSAVMSKSSSLCKSKLLLDEFFKKKNIKVEKTTPTMSSNNSTDSFKHFNSKLISQLSNESFTSGLTLAKSAQDSEISIFGYGEEPLNEHEIFSSGVQNILSPDSPVRRVDFPPIGKELKRDGSEPLDKSLHPFEYDSMSSVDYRLPSDKIRGKNLSKSLEAFDDQVYLFSLRINGHRTSHHP